MFLYTDHQALEPLIKPNICNQQYSTRLTRWLDQLANFNISIQHIAGSNLEVTDFLSCNPVEVATTESMYDEHYVVNILRERAELIFEMWKGFYEPITTRIEHQRTHYCKMDSQSKTKRTFEKNRHVNKTNQQREFSPNSDAIKFKRQETLLLHSYSELPASSTDEEMDRNYFHW